ncbi:MAG: hypothetical protein ACTSXD_05105 [Candidatus Heimdallarchaeaceae archaeon]
MGWSGIKNYGFGTRPKEVDDAYRAKSHKKRTWTKEKCIKELEEILNSLKKILKENEKIHKDNPLKLKNETVRDLVTMQNKILDFMKYLYPQPQVNLNFNVEMIADKVLERIRNYKQELIIQKGGIENGGS